MVGVDFFDHLPAPVERVHLLEDRFLPDEGAYPSWTKHLVSRESVEVAPDFAEVYWKMRDGLGPVNNGGGPCVLRHRADGGDVVDGPQNIRTVGERQKLGVFLQRFLQALHVELSIWSEPDESQMSPFLLRQ